MGAEKPEDRNRLALMFTLSLPIVNTMLPQPRFAAVGALFRAIVLWCAINGRKMLDYGQYICKNKTHGKLSLSVYCVEMISEFGSLPSLLILAENVNFLSACRYLCLMECAQC
jgi:hypothetical protein